ncbi:hypothetical protein NIIDNTM18_41970 [Mycolicibacterium litorale]|uniref:Uncharacterized protein n=1 Tax=Mycolicibacterium litorale TaxID=758802 RepID=A0A6S6P934_9MYCO|nr:hypothetical protein NIIDNTM18_41970 [Mycolicibacterium litorale]
MTEWGPRELEWSVTVGEGDADEFRRRCAAVQDSYDSAKPVRINNGPPMVPGKDFFLGDRYPAQNPPGFWHRLKNRLRGRHPLAR